MVVIIEIDEGFVQAQTGHFGVRVFICQSDNQGIINFFSSFFVMKALQVLPGIVVYPMNGIGTILMSAITSTIVWKERLTRNNYIFITLASVALLLIYPDVVYLVSNWGKH